MKSFGRYAKYYDLIYYDKNYEKECDFLEEIFRRFSLKRVNTILDGGCGTGGHALPLAKRGYNVVGIDSSEIMIKKAREKAERANLSLNFQVMDLRRIDLNIRFDAALCMFAVMDYLPQTEDILKALVSIRRHLKKHSLFVFDFWNGLAVLRMLPSPRIKVIEDEEKSIIRITQPELDSLNHICRLHFRLLVKQNNALIDEVEETHIIRFLFPQEIMHYLKDAEFKILRICPFLDLNGKVNENVWNIVAIAKAV